MQVLIWTTFPGQFFFETPEENKQTEERVAMPEPEKTPQTKKKSTGFEGFRKQSKLSKCERTFHEL